MNLLYLKTLPINPVSKPTSRALLKVKLPSQKDIHGSKEELAFKKFEHLMEVCPENHWLLVGEFKFYDDGKSPMLDITLEGDLLARLHKALYQGSGRELLQICVTVKVTNPTLSTDVLGFNDDESDGDIATGVIRAMKMKVDMSKQGVERHLTYFQRQVPLPKVWIFGEKNWSSFENYTWTVSVDLDVSNLVDLSGLLDNLPGKMSKVLDEKLFTDFEFISSDGKIIHCHKAIISASSPMFMAKCQGKLDEPSKNQMIIDMTENGVHALLEFIYGGEVRKPMMNPNIALELFQASHQYGISDLEKIISEIFVQKQHEWWEIDVAFDLFRFLVNYEGESCEKLKKKVVHVVALKSNELSKCEMFEMMLQEAPHVANEMFSLMAHHLKSHLEG